MKPNFLIMFLTAFSVATIVSGTLAKDVSASSPSFVRQEITDSLYDIQGLRINSSDGGNYRPFPDGKEDFVNCTAEMTSFPAVDLTSVSYVSDGTTINATLWLDSAIKDPMVSKNRDTYQEVLRFNVGTLNSENVSLASYLNDTIFPRVNDTIEGDQSLIRIMNATTLDGIPAYKIEYEDPFPYSRERALDTSITRGIITAISNGKSYTIEYEGEAGKFNYPIGKSPYSLAEIINFTTIDKVSVINQQELSDHSVYENYGMRIEYPSSWEKIDVGDFGFSLETSGQGLPDSVFYINAYDLSAQNITSDQFSNATIRDIAHTLKNFTILNSSKTTFASNNLGHQITGIGNITGYGGNSIDRELMIMATSTIISDRAYSIIYATQPNNFSKYRESIEQVVNSIQFSSETADNVLAYTDSKSGIRIIYPSDWKVASYVNDDDSTSAVFTSPYEIDPLIFVDYSMYVDVNSVYDTGLDYLISIHWDEKSNMWERTVSELSSNGGKLEIEDIPVENIEFSDQNYVKFHFDLKTANFPDQYSVLFTATDRIERNRNYCEIVDVTQFVTVPPPEFLISTSSTNPLIIRPGEEQSIELLIKSNTNLNSRVSLFAEQREDIDVAFTPNRVSLRPLGEATSILTIRAQDSAIPREYSIPIMANISLPSTVKRTVQDQEQRFPNPISANITNNSNITLTIDEPLTFDQHLSNFSNAWISPISVMWTFLAGVAAVMAPLLMRVYRKRQHKSEDENLHKSNG